MTSDRQVPSVKNHLLENLGVILYLPSKSVSLDYRPYLDLIDSTTSFVKKFVSDFSLNYPQTSLCVVTDSESEYDTIKLGLGNVSTSVIVVTHKVKILAFAKAAKLLGKKDTAFVSLEFLFAPDDLLSQTYLFHVIAKNTYTNVIGLPLAVTPEIYSSDLIVALGNLRIPFLPSEPKLAIERLLLIAATDEVKLPIDIRSKPYDAAVSYKCDPVRLPKSISIDTPDDMRIGREVLRSLESTPNSLKLAALYTWKSFALKEQDESLKSSRFLQALVPNQPPRVLYVSNASAFSGAEESLCHLINNLDHSRYRPHALIAMSGTLTRKLVEFTIDVTCPEREFYNSNLRNFLYLIDVIKTIRPDIIHLNGPSGMPILFAAALFNIPTVIHLRVVHFPWPDQLQGASAIIAISNYVKQEALKSDISEYKIHVIYNGVDTNMFTPLIYDKQTARKKFKITPSSKAVLMIARYSTSKRHDLLLQAAKIIKRTIPAFQLHLVGESFNEPEHYESIRAQVSDGELEGCVRFHEFQSDIRAIIAAADVVVLCSDREPLGRSVLEAMAMGIPCVVTNSGALPEIIQDNVTGLIATAGDPNELAKCILTLLTNTDLSIKVMSQARERIKKYFTIERCANDTMKLYDELIQHYCQRPQQQGVNDLPCSRG